MITWLVILVLICYSVPNFIKIGSRVRSLDAHDCRMFNAPLLSNRRCHGNRVMADTSGTRWEATTLVSSQSVDCLASYGISNIFQHGGRPPFWIFKSLIFDHTTVIVVLICRRVPNVIKIGSRVRPPDAHNCTMFMQRPSPWQPNREEHVGGMMGCDHPSWVSVGLLLGELWHF